MNETQQQRSLKVAASRVASAILSSEREREPNTGTGFAHIRSRLTTVLVWLNDEIERFEETRARAAALALVLSADFCWQSLRALSDRSGNDESWIEAAQPDDWKQSDVDIGDDFYGSQRRIIENAKWVFDLHLGLRHPKCAKPDLIGLLRDPVEAGAGDRLISAARGIRQVWRAVQVRIDPTVRAGAGE